MVFLAMCLLVHRKLNGNTSAPQFAHAMRTIHERVGHCHEELCGKGKDEFL